MKLKIKMFEGSRGFGFFYAEKYRENQIKFSVLAQLSQGVVCCPESCLHGCFVAVGSKKLWSSLQA